MFTYIMDYLILLIMKYKYGLLVPLAIIEGPTTMMASGVFMKLGFLDFIPAFVCLLVGDVLGDMIWYSFGFFGGRPFIKKFGKYIGVTEEKVNTVIKIFHDNHSKILFFSKITMGFGFAVVTLFTAGFVKIPFRRFVFWNVVGGLFWTSGLMLVGFVFGNIYLKVDSILGKISVIVLIVIAFFVLMGVSRYIKNRVEEKIAE